MIMRTIEQTTKAAKVIAAIAVLSLLICCQRRDGIYTLDIYATNDLHGKYFDSLYSDNKANRTSLANVSAYMKQERASKGENNVILADIGDMLQGDNAAYYANFIDTNRNEGKHLFVRIAEDLKYDFLVMGNHDIETGHPVYDRVKDELEIPLLAANAVDKRSGKAYFQEYVILNRGGLRLAIIGMTNANIRSWLDEELWSGMDFMELPALADSLVGVVRKRENPDIVALAIHAGIGEQDVYDLENPAKYLAANVKGIDFILAAHDHRSYCGKVFNGEDSVLVIESGSRAAGLSNISIKAEFRNGRLLSKEISGKVIPMADIPKDEEYLADYRAYFNKVKEFSNRKVGTLPKEIYTCDAYFGPSDYMSLIHSIQLICSGADISLAAPLTQNGYIKAGDFNYQDLFTIYPFENQLFVVELSGMQIKNYLERSYDNWIATMHSSGDHIMNIRYDEKMSRYTFRNFPYNFDSAANIEYEVDVTKPYGERINIKSFTDGKEFAYDTLYRVAMSSYRASGGGDLLVTGAAIPAEELKGIVKAKLADIRSLIYDLYRYNENPEIKSMNNWKFIPESYAAPALKRDKALLFGSR